MSTALTPCWPSSAGLLSAAKPAPGAIDAGCSAFTGRTEEGKPIYGRNFDYKMKMTAVMVRTAPKDGYRSIGMADAGWVEDTISAASRRQRVVIGVVAMPYLIMDGMNEKGLAVSVLETQTAEAYASAHRQASDYNNESALRLMLDKRSQCRRSFSIIGKI